MAWDEKAGRRGGQRFSSIKDLSLYSDSTGDGGNGERRRGVRGSETGNERFSAKIDHSGRIPLFLQQIRFRPNCENPAVFYRQCLGGVGGIVNSNDGPAVIDRVGVLRAGAANRNENNPGSKHADGGRGRSYNGTERVKA
jgi:hypothetical protein